MRERHGVVPSMRYGVQAQIPLVQSAISIRSGLMEMQGADPTTSYEICGLRGEPKWVEAGMQRF